jgi:uncharacterized membrane protein YphA (DoxX/SURF4 family)
MAGVLLASRWLLSVVLVVAGAAKLRPHGRDELVVAIENYGVRSGIVSLVLAVLLPRWELALGFMLAAGVLLVPAAACVALTLVVFATATGWHLAHGRRFACGCGAGGEIGWALTGRDLVLAALAVAVATGPSAALAAWPGWGAAPVAGTWQAWVPIPLAVTVLTAGWRLSYAARSARGWRVADRRGRLAS